MITQRQEFNPGITYKVIHNDFTHHTIPLDYEFTAKRSKSGAVLYLVNPHEDNILSSWVSINEVIPVMSKLAVEFEKELFVFIKKYCDLGLSKPELLIRLEYISISCKLS